MSPLDGLHFPSPADCGDPAPNSLWTTLSEQHTSTGAYVSERRRTWPRHWTERTRGEANCDPRHGQPTKSPSEWSGLRFNSPRLECDFDSLWSLHDGYAQQRAGVGRALPMTFTDSLLPPGGRLLLISGATETGAKQCSDATRDRVEARLAVFDRARFHPVRVQRRRAQSARTESEQCSAEGEQTVCRHSKSRPPSLM